MLQKSCFWLTAIVICSLSSGYTGYQLGKTEVEQVVARVTDEFQHNVVVGKKIYSQSDVDALAAHIGQLQARLLRLEALGQHLAQSVDVDLTEFDFSHLPAQGGLDSDDAMTLSVVDLRKDMTQLVSQLDDRSRQLTMLQNLLVQQNLNEVLIPEGRPVKDSWVSSPFGYRIHPITGKRELHKGIDFAGKRDSPIHSVAAGVVVWSGKRGNYGNMVEIQHGDGYITRYAHNHKNLVRVGDRVEKNQTIALMGSTGRSTGYHVHFEVIRNEKVVNPAKYMQALK